MASCKKDHKTGKYQILLLFVALVTAVLLYGCAKEPEREYTVSSTTDSVTTVFTSGSSSSLSAETESSSVGTSAATSATEQTETDATTEQTETDATTEQTKTDATTEQTETDATTEPMTEVVVETQTEAIPFDTEYVLFADMYEDERRTGRAGKTGVMTVKTTVTLLDGAEIGRIVETEVSEPAEPEIIYVGTKPIHTAIRLTEKRPIGRTVEYVYDDTMYEDERKVSEGSDGIVTSTYLVRFERGEESTRELLSSSVLPPQSDIIRVGTKPIFSYKTEQRTENVVPFSTEYKSDGTIYEGETSLFRDGSDGYETNTYKITFERGVRIGEELISSAVTTPVCRVILTGTKKKEETFRMPFLTAAEGGTDYRVTQYFGGSNSHGGIDFGVYYGDKILAAMSGKVVYAYDAGYFGTSNILWTYGTYVVIEHENGYRTYYAHLSSRSVSVGDEVKQGQTIGRSGNTGRVSPAPTEQNKYAGTHLHFEMRKLVSGSYVKVDPKEYLPRWKK